MNSATPTRTNRVRIMSRDPDLRFATGQVQD
jgi:hypothetical protein